jgi:hypothetical protein
MDSIAISGHHIKCYKIRVNEHKIYKIDYMNMYIINLINERNGSIHNNC